MGAADTAGHEIVERIMRRAVERAHEGRQLHRVQIADVDFDDAMNALGASQLIGSGSCRISTAAGVVSVFASSEVEIGVVIEDRPPAQPRGGRHL